MSNNEILFESLIRTGGPFEITDVEMRDNITFFKINGHQYSTIGTRIYHKDNPMFDHPITKAHAERINDPEAIADEEKQTEEVQRCIALFLKHRQQMYQIIFVNAIHRLFNRGPEAFADCIDKFLSVSPTEEGEKLIEFIEKRYGKPRPNQFPSEN